MFGVKIYPMPEMKFRELVERISKYVNFNGCESEEEIEDKIKEIIKMYEDRYKNTPPVFQKDRARFQRSARRWRDLLKGFAFRLLLESWLNPHPVYKEILGMDDDVYNLWIEEKKKAEIELKKLKKLI